MKKIISLKDKKKISFLFKKGRTKKTMFFICRHIENKKMKTPSFAIIISAKISKKAVKRNLLKRQIKEIIRKNISKVKSIYDIVLIVKKNILDASFKEIEEDLIFLFENI